ncbi:MAG TPA: M48 family metallopeptidase [Candidatus Tripitaka californicus]|uniref:M48 family metallopeptidase n=2 Tax=Candidatus Tripitaka californicus TaxID=3367616 RepID=UPI004028BFCC|nr:M48 family metallopeptidase [Planctomycetota bacterium]
MDNTYLGNGPVPIPKDPDSTSREYNRRKYLLVIISLLMGLGYLLAMALYLSVPLREWATSMSVGARCNVPLQVALYYAAFFWLYLIISLPLEFYSGFILEHRYGLSRQGLGDWAKEGLKGTLLAFGLSLFMVEVLYFILYNYTEYWWLMAGLVFTLFALVMAGLAPVLILPLFYKSTPIEDESLRGMLVPMAREAGLDLGGVFKIDLSKNTRKANALLAGLGKTRRVIFSDTLLESFTPQEIQVVFAHELGHHVHRHIQKLLLIGSLTVFAGLALADYLLRQIIPLFHIVGASASGGHVPLHDVATLPIFLLVIGAFAVVLLPLENAYSRHLERQCDLYALDKTRNPQAFISAMEKLADKNLADRNPGSLIEYLFYDHPPISKRIEMAKSRGRGPGVREQG